MLAKNKKGLIFVYILILINVSLILGFIVFNNFNVIKNNINFGINTNESFTYLFNKGKIALDSVKLYNSNGNGFLDGISCPKNVTMSGTTSSGFSLVSDIIYNNGIIVCIGDYNGEPFKIFFNDNHSDFHKVHYKGKTRNIIKSLNTILRLLNTRTFYNTVSAPEGDDDHDISKSMDGNIDTYYKSDEDEDDVKVYYNFVPPINIGKIILKKRAHYSSDSDYWNKGEIELKDSSGDKISKIKFNEIRNKSELEFDLKYLGLENPVTTLRVKSEYGHMDISELEIYELVSDGTEEIWEGDFDFDDDDNTKIKFDITGIGGGDNIDDDFNSDDYRATSIGDTYYPNGFQDDDVIPRKVIFGNLFPLEENKNIFWTNEKTNDFIDKNTNNNDILNIKAGEVDIGYMFIDFYSSGEYLYDLKILEFDRNVYNNQFSLLPIKSYNGNNLNYISGYIKVDINGNLSFSNNIIGNEFVFDFKNKDYGIFISNKTNENIVYRLSAKSDSGTGVYINPINDSLTGALEILSNNITLGGERNFIGDSQVIIFPN